MNTPSTNARWMNPRWMNPCWTSGPQKSVFVLALALGFATIAVGATFAQENQGQSRDSDNGPVLKARPHDDQTSDPRNNEPRINDPRLTYSSPVSINAASPNAVPEGTRFIVKLKDTLDTRKLEQGKHFKAELREDLITANGSIIPKGRTIKGHVARFERGYTGARLMLATDEIETRHGWVPLIATVMGVPGDPSIKSTGEEGEIARKGPDKKRVITNAAIGAGVGAATGAMAGGGKGAAIGAAAGAGLGTGSSWLMKGEDLKLDKGTQLELRLDRDTQVPTH